MNETTARTAINELLARCKPENREAFLLTWSEIFEGNHENDEVVLVARHLENCCAVMGDLSITVDVQALRAEIKELTDAVRSLKPDVRELRQNTTIVLDASRLHIWSVIGVSFLVGALACLVVTILCSHFRFI
jgi:hypothetical protein